MCRDCDTHRAVIREEIAVVVDSEVSNNFRSVRNRKVEHVRRIGSDTGGNAASVCVVEHSEIVRVKEGVELVAMRVAVFVPKIDVFRIEVACEDDRKITAVSVIRGKRL